MGQNCCFGNSAVGSGMPGARRQAGQAGIVARVRYKTAAGVDLGGPFGTIGRVTETVGERGECDRALESD